MRRLRLISQLRKLRSEANRVGEFLRPKQVWIDLVNLDQALGRMQGLYTRIKEENSLCDQRENILRDGPPPRIGLHEPPTKYLERAKKWTADLRTRIDDEFEQVHTERTLFWTKIGALAGLIGIGVPLIIWLGSKPGEVGSTSTQTSPSPVSVATSPVASPSASATATPQPFYFSRTGTIDDDGNDWGGFKPIDPTTVLGLSYAEYLKKYYSTMSGRKRRTFQNETLGFRVVWEVRLQHISEGDANTVFYFVPVENSFGDPLPISSASFTNPRPPVPFHEGDIVLIEGKIARQNEWWFVEAETARPSQRERAK